MKKCSITLDDLTNKINKELVKYFKKFQYMTLHDCHIPIEII